MEAHRLQLLAQGFLFLRQGQALCLQGLPLPPQGLLLLGQGAKPHFCPLHFGPGFLHAGLQEAHPKGEGLEVQGPGPVCPLRLPPKPFPLGLELL